jgi:hypothetical protein
MYIGCPCTLIIWRPMAAAVERIVVQTTTEEKKAIVAKARRLGLPISELMRRGASAYEPAEADEELGALADAARTAADRASAAIDDALAFIEASNQRIAALETERPVEAFVARERREASTSVARSAARKNGEVAVRPRRKARR